MQIYRLVTPKNLRQRAEQAFLVTTISGQSLSDYIESKNLRFSKPQLRRLLALQVTIIRSHMQQDIAQLLEPERPALTRVK